MAVKQMRLIIGNRPGPICRACRKLHGQRECPRRKVRETPGGKLLRQLAEAYAVDRRKFA